MDLALASSRKVIAEAIELAARALASGREFLRGALCVLVAPHLPAVTGAPPPRVILLGVRYVLGVMRTLSRIAVDATRAETAVLRVFDATCRYPAKFTLVGAEAAFREKGGARRRQVGFGPFAGRSRSGPPSGESAEGNCASNGASFPRSRSGQD